MLFKVHLVQRRVIKGEALELKLSFILSLRDKNKYVESSAHTEALTKHNTFEHKLKRG